MAQAGLSFTAYYTRKFIKWGAVGVIVYTILHFTVIISWNLWTNRAKRVPPPAAAFGPLPPLTLPQQDDNLVFNFRLETISGDLPAFPDRAKVFINSTYLPSFSDLNSANDKAKKLTFDTIPIPITETRYRWRKLDGLTGLLELHIFQGDFDMILDWSSNEATLVRDRKSGADKAKAFQAARTVIRNAGSWSSEWEGGSYATLYYEYVNGQLIEVDRLERADFIHLNLRPKPLVEDFEFASADPLRPAVWALVARRNNQVVEMHYRYYGIERGDGKSTEYPLRSIQEAWQQVLNNDVYIAKIGENNPGEEVIVRHFKLAYFLPTEHTPYTQPIYIILGDNGFVGYVPAIHPSQFKSTP